MKRHLVLGGTGTLGQALTSRLLVEPENEVICFSRCELKQKQVASQFKNNRLSFILGDIRNYGPLLDAMDGVDVIYHVAALKHIEILEDNPEESVRTNVLGTMNVADAAVRVGIPYVLFSSTDKAVDPINAYGMSKGLSEKILLRRNSTQRRTNFSVYRWGNVLGSRGSAIHAFADTLRLEQKVYVTSAEMTRFWIRIQDAVDFMLSSYKTLSTNAKIPPIKAASLTRVIEALANVVGVDSYETVITGLRPGEKLHEAMISQHSIDFSNSFNSEQLTNKELVQMIQEVLES